MTIRMCSFACVMLFVIVDSKNWIELLRTYDKLIVYNTVRNEVEKHKLSQ